MKNVFNFSSFFYGILLAILASSFNACTEELVVPNAEIASKEIRIKSRTDGPVSIELIKQKVSTRDNIPLSQILTCSYYGQTNLGFWEYHLTTQYDGPKIYIVTKIIGDEIEGC
ncbi:MAG: hypothetical protein IPP15_09015 [Saprospiraceae bacterium]|uniref:Uncharacterized protein n=1 Tax=Candidatus Opimibacter skivensis TaxID=2982028 RepID=A0A9D7SVB0_9BACT|nr:hypothetical protein [Candidatus Opimibacter skivensis]